MDFNLGNCDNFFSSLVYEGLDRNRKSVATWMKYKSDLEVTKEILLWLPKKLKHDVMVPIGPKALMRGKIVHTNELLVNIGETWFVKKTATETSDLCDRRIKECDVMLEKLEKEKELLDKKLSLPAEHEAFGSEDRPEIIEHISEEEHLEWKKQHRIKEREYRQKLAECRNKEKKQIETEEDLWERLDELELREELEDELFRLNAESEDNSGEEYIEEDEEENDNVEFAQSDNISNSNINLIDASKNSVDTGMTNIENKTDNKRRVTFAVDSSDGYEPLRLEIKHSSNEPELVPFNGFINTPADIYQTYLKSACKKSILVKNENINSSKELEGIKNEQSERVEFHINSGITLPDVFDRDVSESQNYDTSLNVDSDFKQSTRKISKFKLHRMKKS